MRRNETKSLPTRESDTRDVFDFSASDNLIVPSLSIFLFPVLSENEISNKAVTVET
jgi:hypothetical protein